MNENVKQVNSIEEMFEALDGVTTMRKRYAEIVAEYLPRKERQPYYLITYEDDPETCNDVEVLRPLTQENIDEINALLDSYIDKEYAEEVETGGKEDAAWRADILPEVIGEFSDKRYLWKENMNFNTMEVINIDLNNPYYCYRIKIATFPDGMANAPKIIDTHLNLSDDQYSFLVVESMLSSNFSLNKLRTKNEELYNIITNSVDGIFHKYNYPCDVPTYAVEFTEIKDDAERLLNSIESKIY